MIDPGYDKEIRDDGIIIFRIRSTQRPVVDRWYQDVAGEFARALNEGRATRFIYDARRVNLANPYILKRASDLANLPLPPDWRVATLVSSGFLKHFVHTIRVVSLTSQEMFERSQIFTDEDEAVRWLSRP